ncbi:MAG: DNA-binding transcriptional regulator [Pirellulales bacterium]|nr:DNA-binding transcriptional regulator [Pirellulales bacterium]
MAKRWKIALLIESSRGYGRSVLRGIARYAQAHGPWALYHQERSLGESAPRWLSGWDGDGIIARVDSPTLLRQVRQTGLPTVDLRLSFDLEDIPSIGVDNRAVTRMAADHLLDRRFQHYAACGYSGVNYSEERCTFFSEYLAKRGYEVSVWTGPSRPRTSTTSSIESHELTQDEGLRAWLESLPKPVGILATNDVRGQQVLTACGFCGLAVPDEVAVLGVDNDPVVCELCNPPLSSIELSTDRIGYEAASVLDRMLQGAPADPHRRHLPPTDLIVRQSTDVLAVPDPTTSAAVHFIREHACEGIDVEDVLRHVGCSRSTLERRFAKHLESTPRAEIVRIRLDRVKQLLIRTDYPLSTIAQLAGFNHVEYMCGLFKSKTGLTAGQFRAASRPDRA